jgi:hypothetical protein
MPRFVELCLVHGTSAALHLLVEVKDVVCIEEILERPAGLQIDE